MMKVNLSYVLNGDYDVPHGTTIMFTTTGGFIGPAGLLTKVGRNGNSARYRAILGA